MRWHITAVLLAALLAGCAEPDAVTSEAPASNREIATPGSSPTPVSTRAPSATPTTPPTVASATAAPERAGAYLALGDSVTFGVGVREPTRQGFPALVAERLGGLAPRVLAVPGETASGFLAGRVDDTEAAIRELGPRLRLVTIGLGANEILRVRREPACLEDRTSATCRLLAADAAEGAAAALDALVGRVTDALAAAGSEARVLLLAYYNPEVDPIATATIVGADGVVGCDPGDPAPGLNDRIACVAERRGLELVDLHAAFLGRERELTGVAAGDVHPNEAGYQVIADVILEHLDADAGG